MVSSQAVPATTIGLDARLTHYTRGGISSYIRHLAEIAPKFDPDNRYLVLHSRKAATSLAMPANARRVDCWTPAHHRLERTALGLELLPLGLDLLHSPDFIPPRGAFRSIITVHDLTFLHFPEFLTPESRSYYNGQIKAAVGRADHILTDSDSTRDDLLDMLPVAPYRVTTVYLAPDSSFQPQSRDQVEAVLSRHKLPGNFILFVGTFEPRKNVAGLLTAYTQIPDAPPLVLAGNTGWLFDSVRQRIADLGLANRVAFLTDLPDSDLPALYSAAAVLCLPSFYEGFGLPVLEAMACGTPVVIANRASLPEIAGDAALRCDPDDAASIAAALQTALGDSAARQALVTRGFARVRQFSWEKCAQETVAVYRLALRGIA
jgi:glycosyltransferase involved in cell wall biosynthesis